MKMKRIVLIISTVTALSTLSLLPDQAHASPCDDSLSFIRLPGQQCFNLTYLTVLGSSRRQLNQATQEYVRALDVNTPMPTTYITRSRTSENGERSVSTTTVYSDNPTLEEKRERRQLLQDTASNLGQAAGTNEVIERRAFKYQLEVLNAISGILAQPQR